MDVSFLLKIGGIGMTVAVCCQILSRIGRDDQATMVSVAGIILALFLLVDELGELFSRVGEVFGL